MTKIDVISGFLGAGKTTFIKKLLAEAITGEQVILIENEFGEIGIDGGFLKDAGIEIREMNSGCICCSLVGDFETALKEVIETYHPDRIIIEPSGVGKLSDVIKAVKVLDIEEEIRLNSASAVVDSLKCKVYMKNFGEFFNDQIKSAGAIILSRTQNQTEEKLKECVDMIKELNPDARVITTPWESLTGNKMMEAIEGSSDLAAELTEEHMHGYHHHHEEECDCGHHHHEEECCCSHHHEEDHNHGEDHGHHHADEIFSSWGMETPNKYTQKTLEEILRVLADTRECGQILRSKGILQGEDGNWMHFDLVPKEYEIREGQADFTGRICVIGAEIKENKLRELFKVG